ncbi:SDR family NAD(P)-dependent oxidoreductase [Frankia sp. AgPm24]|uniref:SDR family oxidoreductase n=1 Tax=Frankia sp. AgPm24 TaxID=631128 RepID=UPI00200CC099|nr:SDR family NAD(P)-dependent oxidoreductase [Frankia sp. AgPm24]MCK9925137.1 SDR family NAD(P)-dependent oxidoreductase [Frankia sp. AgPm24]
MNGSTLRGWTAIVTGASSGIGRSIAEALGTAGAAVHLIGRTPEPMAASAARITAAGGTASTTVLDIRDADALTALVDQVADRAGRLDVMVNNAGIASNRPILDETPAAAREMLELNVLALLTGCQAAIAAMRRTGSGGRIINISSTSAQRPDGGVYGASKAAVSYLGEGLRQELEADDIRITTVLPGAIATNVVRNFTADTVTALGGLAGTNVNVAPGERIPQDILDAAQAAYENHLARPEDIADAVLHVLAAPLRLNIPELVIRPAQTIRV